MPTIINEEVMPKKKIRVTKSMIKEKMTSPNYRCDFRDARRIDSNGKEYTVDECVYKFAKIAAYFSERDEAPCSNRDAFLKIILDYKFD